MGSAYWEGLQQDTEREVCLGHWDGWSGLQIYRVRRIILCSFSSIYHPCI